MEYDIKKDNNKFVMMGCDGIWENDDANDKNINQGKWNIEKMKLDDIINEKIFQRIVGKKATSDEGTDNMTCIIIKFK
jgi:serine/threonine protein phosphatase PrpC